MKHLAWAILGGLIGCLVLLGLAGWSIVVFLPQPLDYAIVRQLPWPVACSTKGCITTRTWWAQQQAAAAYAAAFQQPTPTLAETLTTVLRKKLVTDSTLKSTVTITDATKYRTQILNLTDDQLVKNKTGLSAAEYDQQIVLPFLQQESLKAQRKIESTAQLYSQLASEHWIFIPLLSFRWDSQQGQVLLR